MAAVRAGAVLVLLSVLPVAERVSGQRAPCYQCELKKDGRSHPTQQQVRSHCTYPCECDERQPSCADGAPVVRDGCGCCPICAAQIGQPCDGTAICDERKGLVCHYAYLGAAVGTCQATTGYPCMVSNKTYNHGETFQMDCRTQCSCQNGTYACSSLCPNENISPTGACKHPRLVEVPDQCCREWMCDSTEETTRPVPVPGRTASAPPRHSTRSNFSHYMTPMSCGRPYSEVAEHPPVCKPDFTSWSTCSASCGLGISHRVSNLNQDCALHNETRICQLRPCELGMLSMEQRARHHHIRKGHECKATQRVSGPVRLRFGPCRSRKRYRPKFCGSCADKVDAGCCTPQLSTTIKVEFICDAMTGDESADDILLDLIEPGRDLWWPDDLMAIVRSGPGTKPTDAENALQNYQETTRTVRTKSADDDFQGFHQSLGWDKPSKAQKHQQIPYYDIKDQKKTRKETRKVSLEDMHLLENRQRNEAYEPLLGASVLVYDPNYDEKLFHKLEEKPSKLLTDGITVSLQETSGEKEYQGLMTTPSTVTEVVPAEATTTKLKKKKKKKPRKAFTSWLEFRDEEYQMDEYEDEENEASQKRKRRSVGQEKMGEKIVRRTHRDGGEQPHGTTARRERSTGSGSFREGHLEETHDEDYDDDNERDEQTDDEEEEDEDEEKEEEEEPEKPLYYAFYRRKRGLVPKQLDHQLAAHLSPQFVNTQEFVKKKKLKKDGGKYKNQIERKSNLLRKIMTEEQQGRKAKNIRVFSQSQWGEIGKHNQEMRKRKLKRKNHTGSGRKEDKREPLWGGQPGERTSDASLSGSNKPLSKLEKIKEVSARRPKEEAKPHVIHTAGKVHKARTRRHAPRPPWEVPGEDLSTFALGDHTVSFSVEWIVKCRCDKDCESGYVAATTPSSELSNDGEVILRRVHRTAPP